MGRAAVERFSVSSPRATRATFASGAISEATKFPKINRTYLFSRKPGTEI